MYPEISSFKLSQRDSIIPIYLDDLREILSKILGTIVVSRALASLSLTFSRSTGRKLYKLWKTAQGKLPRASSVRFLLLFFPRPPIHYDTLSC